MEPEYLETAINDNIDKLFPGETLPILAGYSKSFGMYGVGISANYEAGNIEFEVRETYLDGHYRKFGNLNRSVMALSEFEKNRFVECTAETYASWKKTVARWDERDFNKKEFTESFKSLLKNAMKQLTAFDDII